MVTSHDVARLAGVSQPTVSRALRDSPKVSEETKQRVRQAARALGYVPSETGRALSSGRTRRIGLLLTDLENQFYPHVIAPMHHELNALGYQLVLQTETADTATVAERLISNALDGVLLATTTVDSVRAGPAARPRRAVRLLQPHRGRDGGRLRDGRPGSRAWPRSPSESPSWATAGSGPSSARATPARRCSARRRCATARRSTAWRSAPATPTAAPSTSRPATPAPRCCWTGTRGRP